MRTKAKNPAAKEKLLNAAQALILKKGFSATSVDEVCKAAKLTKGSFFHYFKSKDELGKILLKRFCDSSHQLMDGEGCEGTDPLKRLYCYIDCFIKVFSDDKLSRGCLLACFSQESADTYPEIRCMCEEGFEEWTRRIEKDMKSAKEKYAPKASFDPGSLAEYFVALLEGVQILARVKHDKTAIKESLIHFKHYLDVLYRVRR